MCTACTEADNDNMSDILQLDGCDSVSSTDSPSDTQSTIDSSSVYNVDTLSEYSYDREVSLDSDYSEYDGSAEGETEDQSEASSEGESEDQSEASIGVVTRPIRRQDGVVAPVWFEEYVARPATLPATRQTVRRDNRFEKCGMLPTVSVPNARSIFPKLNCFVEDMQMRSI